MRLQIIVGDALDELANLPQDSVDLTVTDPPYASLERHRAVGTATRLKQSDASSNSWFNVIPNTSLRRLFTLLHRVHRKDTHCYVFCDAETATVALTGINPYDRQGMDLPSSTSMWTAWPPLTWLKTKAAFSPDPGEGGDDAIDALVDSDIQMGMGYHWRRATETILFLEKGRRPLKELGWKNVLLGPRATKHDFPTQKPLEVLTRLILNSSAPGDTVLDPFAGSGSTAWAALVAGRNAIIIEKYPSAWLEQMASSATKLGGVTVEWKR